MTISSSLNAGVAGLNANATKLASISDNIANSATYGYKRAETDFHSVVVAGTSQAKYAAGGVQVSNSRVIDERGPLIATANATDLAIDGRGFLPVTDLASLDDKSSDYPIMLTTTGSFRRDDDGVLRTTSGQVLMAWPARPDGSIANFARDSTASLTPVRVDLNQNVSNPTTQMRIGPNLPATATEAGSTTQPIAMSVEYYGNLSTAERLDFVFTPIVPATGSSNQWTMAISDSAANGAKVAEYTLTFDSSQGSGGRLATVASVSGGAYDAQTGKIPLVLGGGTLTLQIGSPGQANGFTQLSNNFISGSIDKNGSPVAKLTDIEVDASGNVNGVYDQGFSRRLFQVPLIDVPNPNGLVVMSNQTYEVSTGSGPFYLWNAGDGPTGAVAAFSREESATDVAQELTQLIQTQRAYSSNAKIIQTVDEMWQETTNLKR